MYTDVKNDIAFSISLSEKIDLITKPASDFLGFSTFGYRRFFLDGSSFGTSNNLSWTNYCLENFDKKIIPNYEEEIRAVLNDEKSHFFRIGVPDNQDIFLSSLYGLDIWNTCSLYKRSGEGIEGFYFASTRENISIIERYANNLSLLERFSCYFKNKLFDIMSLDDLKSATSPTISPSLFETYQHERSKEELDIKNFLLLTPIQKFFLTINGQEIALSSQEFRSLALLSQGKTAKEIARVLKISPRTVEDYIENIKRKTKISSRSQLINSFFISFHPESDVLKYLANISEGD